MKNTPKTLLLTGIMALFSASAFAAPLPGEIFQPRGAEVVKADRGESGDFEAEFHVSSNEASVEGLANQVRAHAQRHGFKVVESDIKRDDAGLKFTRRNQALEVSIERNDYGIIEYKADLDAKKQAPKSK